MNGDRKTIKKAGLLLLAISWCALQTAVGVLLALCLLPFSRLQRYRGMIVVYHSFSRTFSLGTFAFVSNGVERPREIVGKMYGHYVQSLLYGPFFFFVVSLPLLFVRIPAVKLRRAERGISPTDLYADRQAKRFAQKAGETTFGTIN